MRRFVVPILTMGWFASTLPASAQAPVANFLNLGSLTQPIQEPASSPLRAVSGQDHVYIFAINGLDPLCLGNFNGACRYLQSRGYANVRFGQLHSSHTFDREIRAVWASDPCAHIVLIGYSFGCNYCRFIANDLARDGIPIDLLAYVAGDTIMDTPRSHPSNVDRVLNITAHGCFIYGSDLTYMGYELTGARNQRLNVLHLQVPSQRETITLLLEELSAVANRDPSAPAWEPGVMCIDRP
jgi:hypothetical protein